MVPNLLIHDHILVKKFSYGLKWPIGDGWLIKWKSPQRGDVIVFRFPENRDVFYIKRLIGLPGDKVVVQNGQISVNGQPWILKPALDFGYQEDTAFTYFDEQVQPERPDKESHVVRFFLKTNMLEPKKKNLLFLRNPTSRWVIIAINHMTRVFGVLSLKIYWWDALRLFG